MNHWGTSQEIWPPCRHHGMVMAMFHHAHGTIMARSWHGSHIFPTQVLSNLRSFLLTPPPPPPTDLTPPPPRHNGYAK